MRAELVFAKAQAEVALVPPAGPADISAMAACSVAYDRVELARVNRAYIAVALADHHFRLGKAVQS
jgi:hypothetical protein